MPPLRGDYLLGLHTCNLSNLTTVAKQIYNTVLKTCPPCYFGFFVPRWDFAVIVVLFFKVGRKNG